MHTNSKLKKEIGTLHPIKVEGQVWKRIGVDIVGPLTATKKGKKYIITCTDYFLKWPEAVAVQTKEAVNVARFLIELICRFGCFEIFHTD